jgi:hypothetical protein
VILTVDRSDLTSWDEDSRAFVPVQGRIHFAIGASSADIRTETDL